jgi:hypothetical protein
MSSASYPDGAGREMGILRTIRRNGPRVVVAALIGLALGVGVGYGGSVAFWVTATTTPPPLLVWLVCGAIAAALVVGLVLWAMVRESIDVGILAATLAIALVIGINVAPGAPGSDQARQGSGSAGTRQSPTALWSGPVSCEWTQDQSSNVQRIVGFNVTVSDPTTLAALGLDTPTNVEAIQIGLSLGDTALLGTNVGGVGAQLTLEDVASDGRSGTAVSPNGAIVFSWSCAGGP